MIAGAHGFPTRLGRSFDVFFGPCGPPRGGGDAGGAASLTGAIAPEGAKLQIANPKSQTSSKTGKLESAGGDWGAPVRHPLKRAAPDGSLLRIFEFSDLELV
jgi:hypothetical protein